MQQSDVFRLTHAIEHLKSQGWVNAVVTDEEWVPGSLYTEYANTSALLVRKSELQRHFNEQGQQTAPVTSVPAILAIATARCNGTKPYRLAVLIRIRHCGRTLKKRVNMSSPQPYSFLAGMHR